MEVREEIWPRAKQYDIGPFWSFCRGIIVYGIANGIPDFLDIREKTKELHDEGFTGFIPFLSIIGNGDEIFCFDKDNNIVLLDCYTTGEAAPVEGAFSDCLMKQIAELEERKNKKIRGEDKNNNSGLPGLPSMNLPLRQFRQREVIYSLNLFKRQKGGFSCSQIPAIMGYVVICGPVRPRKKSMR